jgi:RNA polymerase sigma-70 factor (ECF subfamily)
MAGLGWPERRKPPARTPRGGAFAHGQPGMAALHAFGRPLEPEAAAARNRLASARTALLALPEATRAAFLMHRLAGLDYRAIGLRLGLSAAGVESRIAEACLALADGIDGEREG